MQVELHLPAEGAPGEPARPVVVDTNVALDLLIFSDPRTARLESFTWAARGDAALYGARVRPIDGNPPVELNLVFPWESS